MKSLFFLVVAMIAFAFAIPTPAKACDAALSAQVVCPSAVSVAVAQPAFLVAAAPVVVQTQLAVSAVQAYPSVGFSAQSYVSSALPVEQIVEQRRAMVRLESARFRVRQALVNEGYEGGTFAVGRRARVRGRFRARGAFGLGLNALGLGAEVAIDPLTGVPVEVVDPLFLGGRVRGKALNRGRARARGRRR